MSFRDALGVLTRGILPSVTGLLPPRIVILLTMACAAFCCVDVSWWRLRMQTRVSVRAGGNEVLGNTSSQCRSRMLMDGLIW